MSKKPQTKKSPIAAKASASTVSKPRQANSKTQKKSALSGKNVVYAIFAIVAIVGFIAYWPSLSNDFTNWDDPGYVTQNYDIKDWSKSGIAHLFHSYTMGNYHPITMLSYAFEYHIAALKPYIYHRDSLILHILTSLAVTWLTWLVSRNLFMTAICGVLFAVHPMHVESVAWVAGRKDVLFGLFYFLGLIAYYFYATSKKYKIPFYLLILVFFTLSLLSKAVAVTLPISCLLLDYLMNKPLKIKLLLDKIPLFILSVVFGIISIKAQQGVEAIQSEKVFPIVDRAFFSSYAFLAYIGKMFLPLDLCNFYPYPVQSNGYFQLIWYVYPVILAALLLVIFIYGRKNKELMFGFLFYASAIFLLIQLLPVGTAIIADRYSYIAYFGLFFIIGSFYTSVVNGRIKWLNSLKGIMPFIVAVWVIWLVTVTRARCEVWKNTESLWRDAIEKQPDLSSAYNNLGFELYSQGKYDEAVPLFIKSIKLLPTFDLPYSNLGQIYRLEGKNDLALTEYNKAITLNPKTPQTYVSRAVVYCIKNKLDSAGADFAMALKLDPNLAEAYSNRGNYDDMRGKYDSALADYSKAIELKPEMAEAYENRAQAYIRHKNYDAGIADLNTYLQLKPESADAYMKRSSAYFEKKDYKNALSDANQAQSMGLKVDPNYLENLKKLANE